MAKPRLCKIYFVTALTDGEMDMLKNILSRFPGQDIVVFGIKVNGLIKQIATDIKVNYDQLMHNGITNEFNGKIIVGI